MQLWPFAPEYTTNERCCKAPKLVFKPRTCVLILIVILTSDDIDFDSTSGQIHTLPSKMSQLFQINRLLRYPQTHRALHRLYSAAANTGSKKHINTLVKNNKVVLFMKGVPDQPMCGFSNGMVQVLRMHGVMDFESHNVLEDEDLRQGERNVLQWAAAAASSKKKHWIGWTWLVATCHVAEPCVREISVANVTDHPMVGFNESLQSYIFKWQFTLFYNVCSNRPKIHMMLM